MDIQPKGRIFTRTKLQGKKTVHVPVAKIKPTNTMNWEIEKVIMSPILLVRDDDDDSYYIVDGNHRFFATLCNRKSIFISAWVLEEGDQKKLRGDPLPTYVREWRDGLYDLREFCTMARNVYRRIESDVNKDLRICWDAMDSKIKKGKNIGSISEGELESVLDQSGFLTVEGDYLLCRMGIKVGTKVTIEKSTVQNLVNCYNAWNEVGGLFDPELKLPNGEFADVREDNALVRQRPETLMRSCRMGIKIGEGTRIAKEVNFGLGVSIGKWCEIMDGCELFSLSTVHDNVYLGKAVLLGQDSVVECGSRIMDNVVIAPKNVVRKDSFIPQGVVFDECKKNHS